VLDNVFEADDRFRMLNEIADVWHEQDKNPLRAIEALEEARELQPLNPGLLHKLIALYQATENWSKMIDTLQAIADNEQDPTRKSKFLYTMAQLYRDKEGDQDKAVELFGEALDLNAQYLEAFKRINKILTAKKDWKALERAFRKMLRRMSTANISNPDLEFNLWHNLGLIYRDRLKDVTSAIEAFKMATRFKPDEAVRTADPGGALRGNGPDGGRSGGALNRAAEGSAACRPLSEPLQAVPANARIRSRVVHVRCACLLAEGRRGGAALFRRLPPARDGPGEKPTRQRGVGARPVPQRREPLHRQDL
jgi:tetratricopeptide (TPR) repeat protein